jgi:hypothetical protein
LMVCIGRKSIYFSAANGISVPNAGFSAKFNRASRNPNGLRTD